jgi:transitional endoplasmic reticulum ATPase
MKCLRRLLPELNLEEEKIPPETLDKLIVNADDFKKALVEVTPSGMREVFIENPDVSWDKVGGLAEVKKELMEAVEWPMKFPGLYDNLGHKMPRGILLHGPSGTGKTLMAKAVATQSEANFVSVRGPELLSKWVGESERGIREIFKRARQSAPCVIFFDEIDSIAPIRGAGGETAVTERVVSQLLTELDGMENMHGVVVLAATNRADMIDPALLRPGRFDKIIQIPLPDKESRRSVIEIHSKDIPLAEGADKVDFDKISDLTDGLSSADVASIANTAVSLVVHEHLDNAVPDDNLSDEEKKKIVDEIEKKAADARVTMKHFEEAVRKVREQKDLKMNEKLVASYYR